MEQTKSFFRNLSDPATVFSVLLCSYGNDKVQTVSLFKSIFYFTINWKSGMFMHDAVLYQSDFFSPSCYSIISEVCVVPCNGYWFSVSVDMLLVHTCCWCLKILLTHFKCPMFSCKNTNSFCCWAQLQKYLRSNYQNVTWTDNWTNISLYFLLIISVSVCNLFSLTCMLGQHAATSNWNLEHWFLPAQS